LFDRVKAERKNKETEPVRDFSDYIVSLDGKALGEFKTVVSV
jgi:hypothetical protein